MANINKILNIKPSSIKPSKGRLLISEPFLQDYYFKRSVIILAEHSEEGTFGAVVNKPLFVKMNDLIKDFPKIDFELYLGGPVATNSLFYIHRYPEIANSHLIADDIYWGGDLEVIKEMAALKLLEEEKIRFFLGYSGWVPNQLEGEIKRNSWIISKLNTSIVFDKTVEHIWNKMVISLGEDYAYWVNFPENPIMN